MLTLFLKAQDSDTSLLKTLTVKKNSRKPNLYDVSYSFTDYQSPTVTRLIHLIVTNQNGSLKINNLW